jgi:hypothetical protein
VKPFCTFVTNIGMTRPWLILVLMLMCISACSPTVDPQKPEDKKEKARLVGRIASIHPSENFVLIQSYGPWEVTTGAILATVGTNGRAANLKVTGEKTGQFAAADIQSGNLEIGDSVYTTLSSQMKDHDDPAPESRVDEPVPNPATSSNPN